MNDILKPEHYKCSICGSRLIQYSQQRGESNVNGRNVHVEYACGRRLTAIWRNTFTPQSFDAEYEVYSCDPFKVVEQCGNAEEIASQLMREKNGQS